MRLRSRVAALGVSILGLAALLALASGCSPKNTLVPNVPPETSLFVQGPLDTVNHVVHLYWFGSDPDGEVAGFELRFHNPAAPADTQWTFTTKSDSLFTVFTPTGSTAPLFEVRSIDNDGQRDPTPAHEDFTFSNKPPIVHFAGVPGFTDTTFASATLRWVANDPDGDGARMQFRVWLDGLQQDAHITSGTTFTIPSADFQQNGVYTSGYRKAFVQAVDDGGLAGPPDSTQWFVRAPVTGTRARLLLIDDIPTSAPGNATFDTLYYNTAARNLPPDQYTILRLQFTQPFRSDADVAQTFGQFEAVIWYRGRESISNPMTTFQNGMGTYLEHGGKLLLESLNLVTGEATNGVLQEDWLDRYMGSDRLFKHIIPGLVDSTAEWSINSQAPMVSDFGDSLFAIPSGGLRCFVIRDANYALVDALPGSLSAGNTIPLPICLSVPQPSGGRLVAFSFPARLMHFPSATSAAPANAHTFLAKVFQQMGLTGP
jgi:hypothetical protein